MNPPGPPDTPRCSECDQVTYRQGHRPGCTVGTEWRRQYDIRRSVEDAVAAFIGRRCNDAAFMAQLKVNIEQRPEILDALGDPALTRTTSAPNQGEK